MNDGDCGEKLQLFLGRSMRQCIQRCCSRGKCDVAYSIDGNCYGIECFSENLCHVDDGVPDTTSTEISIIKDLKEKQPSKSSAGFHTIIYHISLCIDIQNASQHKCLLT